MAYAKRELVGVGGWLAFLIVTLSLNALACLVQPFLLTQTPGVERIGSPWTIYLVFASVLAAAKAGGYGYAAWALNERHEPRTPRRVIAILWTLALALALVPALVDAVVGAALLSIPARRAGEIAGAGLVRPVIYAAIWTAYLLRSERVANTFRAGREDEETLAAVFE